MENTSKTLARINSYIGTLELKEKDQKLKKLSWKTSIVAVVFLLGLLALYGPFSASKTTGQITQKTPEPLEALPPDLSTDLIIDTLTVTAKLAISSKDTESSQGPDLAQVKESIPSQSPVKKREPKRKSKGTLMAQNEIPATEVEGEIVGPSSLDYPSVGVMRSSDSSSSDKESPTPSPMGPTWEPDIDPKFPGGRAALSLFIQKNVSYPRVAPKSRKEGTVYVRFVVDEWGSIQEAKVVKGIDPAYDQEALALIEKMPRWIPGKLDGRTVSTYKDLGIMYKMY